MITCLYVPRWGITMERGLIAVWLAQAGERVKKGQPLLEMETEKITNVIESPADGVLRAVLYPAGEKPAVGELIAVIAEPDEAFDLDALRAEAKVAASAGAAREKRAARPAERTERGRVRASPAARKLAQEYGLDLANVAGTGPEGSLSREDVERAVVDAVAATMQDGFASVDGMRLHYLAAGGADMGLKTSELPIVLVHGLGGSTMLWQPNLTALATKHRVFALDLPGHGLSDKPPIEYSVSILAQALTGFLDALGLERAVLVGHSLGGQVCLQVALPEPARVARLALADSGGLGSEINLAFLEPMLNGLNRDATETMLRGLFHKPEFASRVMTDATYEMLGAEGAWDALVSATRAAVSDGAQTGTLTARLNELTMPVLIVWGAEDTVIPIAHAHAALAALPNAKLWIAANAGHCPQLEAAQGFNERVMEFLSET